MSTLNELPSKLLFEQVAIELAIAPSMIEKDWHVTQVLAFLSGLNIPGFQVVFSGGTALSKAHGLIQRFSEDVDFRVVAPEGSTRQKLSEFKNEVVGALRRAGFSVSDPIARDNNKYFTVDIEYKTHFDRDGALRPHIKVELKAVSPQVAVLYQPVQSFVAKLTKKPPEVERIACTAPVESAADKLSALAWRIPNRVRGEKHDDPAIVRHVHDLAMLESIAEKDGRFARLALVSLQTDNDTLLKGNPFSMLSNADKFTRMLDTLVKDLEYPKEYEKFVKGLSYAPEGQEPSFGKAVEAIRRLTKIVLDAET